MRTFSLLCLLFLFAACNSASLRTEEDGEKPVHEEPQMRQYSELAGIMNSIHAFHTVLKDSIESEAKVLPSLPMNLERLHSAEATDPRELDGDYHHLADAYISALDSLENVKYDHRISTYNSAISNCIECHQTRCPGPIPKIRKLRIKENAAHEG